MDIHKPKPWHGWREFLKEIGTIVIGVLIALAAEQGVEWLHWRVQAHEARIAISSDHKRLLGYVGVRDMASPCIVRRLNEVEAILDKASAGGRLPPLGDIGHPPREAWAMRGWDGLVSGQTLAHLSADVATRFSAEAALMPYLRDARDREIDDWSVLRTISGPGRRVSDAELASLRAALGRARNNAFRLRNTGDGLGRDILGNGLLTRAEVSAAWGAGSRLFVRNWRSTCNPIADPAAGRLEDPLLIAPPAAPDKPFDVR